MRNGVHLASLVTRAAVLLAATAALSAPTLALAVASINNNGNDQQHLIADPSMHMQIVDLQSDHIFTWNNTPWLVNQGGTGATAFTDGAIPFIAGGIFSQNTAQLFWDAAQNLINIGGVVSPTAKLNVKGSAGLGLLSLISAAGTPVFSVNDSGAVTAANGMNITSGCYAVNGVCIGGNTPPSGDVVENFEDYPDDVLNGSDSGTGWTSGWDFPSDKVVVQSAVAYEGSKAAKAIEGYYIPTQRTFIPKTAGTLHLAVRADTTNSGFSFVMRSARLTAFSIGRSGTDWYGSGGFSDATPLGSFTTVDVQFDSGADQYRVSLNGGAYGNWFPFDAHVKSIDTLYTEYIGADTYLDDIRITN